MTWLAVIASFALGVAVERSRARYAIGQRQSARYDMLMALGGAVDLEPCEFSHTWSEKR